MRCLGRISKDEKLTFGDGKTPLLCEDRCHSVACQDKNTCEECILNTENSLVNRLIPETCHIFGPTNWFLYAVSKYGTPSRETLKKALEAHNRVVATMGIKKSSAVVKEQLIQLKSIEVDEVIEIKEVKEVTLTLVKIGKKKRTYKDEANNLTFEKNAAGELTLLSV